MCVAAIRRGDYQHPQSCLVTPYLRRLWRICCGSRSIGCDLELCCIAFRLLLATTFCALSRKEGSFVRQEAPNLSCVLPALSFRLLGMKRVARLSMTHKTTRRSERHRTKYRSLEPAGALHKSLPGIHGVGTGCLQMAIEGSSRRR